jgi:CNT family concentrative nucleoside transporter
MGSSANQRAVRWLRAELPALVSSGTISDESAKAIERYYEASAGGSRKTGVVLLAAVGSILVAAGFVLLIAHNWDDFSRPVRSVIAFLPLIAAQALSVFVLMRRNESKAWRECAAIFNVAGVGTAISLVSQTYQIHGSLANFIFVWMLLSLPLVYLMRTSGAETLSVSANVFMGQTEAPLIVKPYVPRMTNSELFVLMASGMAHISGGMMVVYISYGANPVAVLTTCVMACPCSLYLSKLFLPEISRPETGGTVQTKKEKSPYVNAIDAAAVGTTDGLQLALNVGAMLIVFIAFVAMFDAILGAIAPTLINWHFMAADQVPSWLNGLSLGKVFGWIFSPVAFLMGVAKEDVSKVGSLLGSKLSINEHFAYLQMRQMLPKTDPSTGVVTPGLISERSFLLTAFALTGFANFSSVGIQLGGIGAMAPMSAR